MIVKILNTYGFDFTRLPKRLSNGVQELFNSTNGTFESDNEKLNMLDRTVFASIKKLFPEDSAVMIAQEVVTDTDAKIINNGFNTVLTDEDMDIHETIDENFNDEKPKLLLDADGFELPVRDDQVLEYMTAKRKREPEPQLTMLSFGGGQDSYAILYLLIHDQAFRKKYAPNDLLVVMSDTGNEFPYTYKAVKEAQEVCEKNGVHFQFITSDQGYHTPGWMNLKDPLKKNRSILSAQMSSQPCTPNLKITVVNKYMHDYMCELYGFGKIRNKGGWKKYLEKFGSKARVLIGFANNEERRVKKSVRTHKNLPLWNRESIQYIYPLLEEGIDRQMAQDVIMKYHSYLVPPSNCMICFYQSDQEIVWLERNYPAQFEEWEEMEQQKYKHTLEEIPNVSAQIEIETDTEKLEVLKKKLVGMIKNYGVYGKISLREKLEMAKKKYGHMSDEQLWDYKMSHGHCIKSAY